MTTCQSTEGKLKLIIKANTMNEERRIEFRDKRRIKSAEEAVVEIEEADLERMPTFVEQLQSQVDQNDSRLKEYIAAHKEKMAEMDQVRKRLEEGAEKRSAEKFGELIAEIFPALDDLDRAIESASNRDENDPLIEGVVLLKQRLIEALTRNGLEMIECENQPFNPEVAQAVATIPVDEDEKDNIVIEQLAAGFRFGDRVLRPALVQVGRKV